MPWYSRLAAFIAAIALGVVGVGLLVLALTHNFEILPARAVVGAVGTVAACGALLLLRRPLTGRSRDPAK